MTVEELAARVGAIPLWRIRTDPPPGSATEEDVERIRREGSGLCELIDGVLVEKAVSDKTTTVGMIIGTFLTNFVLPRRLGWIQGSDGFTWLSGTQLRAPDASFIRRDQRPSGKQLDRGYADIAPALVVEVFSPGNTARESEQSAGSSSPPARNCSGSSIPTVRKSKFSPVLRRTGFSTATIRSMAARSFPAPPSKSRRSSKRWNCSESRTVTYPSDFVGAFLRPLP